jgi:hypothetical protein
MQFAINIHGIWGETRRIEKVLLFATLGFRILAAILTWYAFEHKYFAERMPWTAGLISRFGAPLGLSVSVMISFVFILFVWLFWVSVMHKRVDPKLIKGKLLFPLLLICVYIGFFGAFAVSFVDFAHDVLIIFFNWDFLLIVLDFVFVSYISGFVFFATIYLVILLSTEWRIKKRN